MSPLDYFRSALDGMSLHKLRSALTTLGVLIGIAAVTAVNGVGAGAYDQVEAQLRAMGTNQLMIVPGSAEVSGANLGIGSNPVLTEGDATALTREVSDVALAAPVVHGRAQVVFGNRNWASDVIGTTPDYFRIRGWGAADGRLFTERDHRSAGKVAVLGAAVAERLFAHERPIGATVRINRVPLVVVGILAGKGIGAAANEDDVVLVPLSTVSLRLLGAPRGSRPDTVDFISVALAGDQDPGAAVRAIEAVLRERHNSVAGDDEGFSVLDMSSLLQAETDVVGALSVVLTVVAAISLLVGGIGIMTMMLVSVTYRTREIGLRLAVGARPADIRNQFMIEAVLICIAGGLCGVALGAAAAIGFARLAGWPVVLDPIAIAMAVGMAATVGIVFGVFPAMKASRLAPVDALRSE